MYYFVQLKYLPFLILPSILLMGCGDGDKEGEEKLAIKPVKTIVIESPEAGGIRQFPGRVDASQKVELAFRIPGKIKKLPAKEGAKVVEGDVIAELDPTDFNVVVTDRQASFDRAKADYERSSQLVKKGVISRADHDKIDAQYKRAKASLQQAQLDLGYTVLKAPFAGFVAKRHVQNFEEVKDKQTIIELQNVSTVEVKIDVPQRMMILINREKKATGKKFPVHAVFSENRDQEFPLTVKEVATKADEKTQTFEATFTMAAPETLNVLPGMTVDVIVDVRGSRLANQTHTVPTSAVVSDIEHQPTIWVVDDKEMSVNPREIKVGNLMGSQIEVVEGLTPGDRVVVAGVSFLRKGMKVRLLPDVEQAKQK